MKLEKRTNRDKKQPVNDNRRSNQATQTNDTPPVPQDAESTSCSFLFRFFKSAKSAIADAFSAYAETMAEQKGIDPYSFH